MLLTQIITAMDSLPELYTDAYEMSVSLPSLIKQVDAVEFGAQRGSLDDPPLDFPLAVSTIAINVGLDNLYLFSFPGEISSSSSSCCCCIPVRRMDLSAVTTLTGYSQRSIRSIFQVLSAIPDVAPDTLRTRATNIVLHRYVNNAHYTDIEVSCVFSRVNNIFLGSVVSR